MKLFFITGISRGIGNAIVQELLKDKNNYIVGLSRNNTIEHPNFKFIKADLFHTENLVDFKFAFNSDPELITLINNAGSLGEIKHIGKLNDQSIIQTINLNLTSMMVLTNEFLKKFLKHPSDKVIINISSGAAKYPFDGWSIYCTSKAGMDMYSQVLHCELIIKKQKKIKIFSIYPGVVETKMQEDIQHVSVEDFSRLDEFINYKKNRQLISPAVTAQKICYLIANRYRFLDVLISLNNIDL